MVQIPEKQFKKKYVWKLEKLIVFFSIQIWVQWSNSILTGRNSKIHYTLWQPKGVRWGRGGWTFRREGTYVYLWQIDGEAMETVTGFIFCGSKIIANSDCSHEIKRCLFFGRKTMTNLQCIRKQRHHFANKGPSSQSYGFNSSHV